MKLFFVKVCFDFSSFFEKMADCEVREIFHYFELNDFWQLVSLKLPMSIDFSESMKSQYQFLNV